MCDKHQLGTDLKSNIEFKEELLQSEKVEIILKEFDPETAVRNSFVGCVVGFASLGNATFLNVKSQQWNYAWINVDHIAEIYLN